MSHPEGAPEPTPSNAAFAAGLDTMSMMADAVAGYHKKLIEGGIGQEAADAMSVEYHSTLMGVMKAQAGVGILKGLAAKQR